MDRRSHERRRVWLPARVEQLEAGMAVTHDASPAGVMIVAASRLEVGASVDMTFQIPPSGEREVAVRGTVVRVDKNTADPYGMWPYRIAVEFDAPDPELEPVIDQLAQTHDPE